jgi:Flp pilus assembly protein TadG
VKTFVKCVVVLAILAGLIFEIGSPLWARADAAGAAQDAASAAARDYFDSANLDSARQVATTSAAVRGVTLTNLTVLPDGSIKVTVSRHAKSYVLHDISALKNWYNVSATATAPPIRA